MRRQETHNKVRHVPQDQTRGTPRSLHHPTVVTRASTEDLKEGPKPSRRPGQSACLTQQPSPVQGCVKVELHSACAPHLLQGRGHTNPHHCSSCAVGRPLLRAQPGRPSPSWSYWTRYQHSPSKRPRVVCRCTACLHHNRMPAKSISTSKSRVFPMNALLFGAFNLDTYTVCMFLGKDGEHRTECLRPHTHRTPTHCQRQYHRPKLTAQ